RGEAAAAYGVADGGSYGLKAGPLFLSAFNRQATGVNLKDLLAAHSVRAADFDLTFEPTRPAERRINRLIAVRRADHDDLSATREAVHQGEELRDDAPFDLAGYFLPLRRNRVEFIDEQDAGSVLLGLLELLAEALLALSVVLRHDLGALNRIEICAGFVGDRLRDECFAGAGLVFQDESFWLFYPEAFGQLHVT